jgi:two-component system, NtrC family, sensor kinase
MKSLRTTDISDNAWQDFQQKLTEHRRSIDQWFSKLLIIEWLVAILFAAIFSPRVWQGPTSSIHIHIWIAVALGGALALMPWYLARRNPGQLITRLVIAGAQVSFSALLIHLSAGRIETHFHVFVSLALLVAYRDIKVFIPAVTITAFDHILRGVWWPQSVFGRSSFEALQPIEHAIWLLLETAGLCFIVQEHLKQWLNNSILQEQLRLEQVQLELRVEERTLQLSSLKQFREEILNSIDASICILDATGRIVFVNEKWSEFAAENGGSFNCSLGSMYLEECVLAKLGSAEFVKQLRENISLVSTSQIPCFRNEYTVESNQTVRHYQLSITPIEVDGQRGVAVVHVDVSHLKRVEKRAAALATLVSESPDEVLIASVDKGSFVEVNEGARTNTGYTREELLKLSLTEIFDEQQTHNVRATLEHIKLSGERVVRFESYIRRKNGTNYPCRVSLHRTQFEELDVWVLFVNDLSEQKSLEAKLLQAQKLEALGTLASGIAHEINTPMQCVVGNFEFLQKCFTKMTAVSDRMIELLDESSVDWSVEREQLMALRIENNHDFTRKQMPMALKEAAESSQKIVSIVRAMTTLSHPGTEDAVLTDIHEIIQNATIISRHHWKLAAELELNFSADVPPIYGFPAELSQVFINLIVNATDAIIEKNGPNPTTLGLIAIDSTLSKDKVIIRVGDTGCGIPLELRQKIFDPFFTTKEVGKGTGQGLSISHAVIVGKHQGSLTVSSEVGLGTVFTIELPVFACAPASRSVATQANFLVDANNIITSANLGASHA